MEIVTSVAAGVRMHAQLGPLGLHIRPIAGRIAQLVADRILELQRAEVAVGDRRMLPGELAGQRPLRVHVLAPVDRAHRVVEGLRVRAWSRLAICSSTRLARRDSRQAR